MVEQLNKEGFKAQVFNFEDNKEWSFLGDKPAIIDFYADWCGPCKMVEPILEKLSKEFDGKVSIYRVDTDQEQELASLFGIQSIPSILFIPQDERPQMAVGALPEATIKKAISEVLKVS